MLLVMIALQVVLLLLVLLFFLRKPVVPAADERLRTLPDAVLALGTRLEATDSSLRSAIAELRRDGNDHAVQARTASDTASRALREEIAGSIASLERKLMDGLNGFRADNAESSSQLRTAVHGELQNIAQRLTAFFAEANQSGRESQEALHRNLTELAAKNTASHDALRDALHQRLTSLGQDQHEHQERLRISMEERLNKLNADNVEKLEQMRSTVDEKLHATLQTRLTESFGQVTTHLGEVQKGLGEMKELATGVSDLKKVFSNVKSRGIVGEFQLGMQLEQMFSPEQYVKNARIKRGTTESVEYALKFPSGNGEVLLPIDAKFPREDWEKLEYAYEHGTAEDIAKAGAAFERTIRAEGRRICEKYIEEPVTLPHAVMFLPTESLYAEVVRRPGLQAEVQQKCRVTIAGPSTFMAILTSFQMGFHSIALEKKGNEVWKVLSNVKTEFGKFEQLMTKVEDNVGKVQKSLSDIGVRTRAINRNLRNVTELPAGEETSPLIAFEEIAGVAPLLAAAGEE